MSVTSPTIIKRVLFAFLLAGLTGTGVYYYANGNTTILKAENKEFGLIELLDGNTRFAKNKMQHPDEGKARRVALSDAQHPFAVVVSCSDSRVPPELIFDQGLGDLFVIRTAGNLVDSLELGSIEYAVEHLGVKLVVVMGHENCGVIKAFLEKGTEHNHIVKLLEEVSSEPEEIETINEAGEQIDNCVRANIKHITRTLQTSEPVLMEKYKNHELTIVGTRYDLNTGEVEIIE